MKSIKTFRRLMPVLLFALIALACEQTQVLRDSYPPQWIADGGNISTPAEQDLNAEPLDDAFRDAGKSGIRKFCLFFRPKKVKGEKTDPSVYQQVDS